MTHKMTDVLVMWNEKKEKEKPGYVKIRISSWTNKFHTLPHQPKNNKFLFSCGEP